MHYKEYLRKLAILEQGFEEVHSITISSMSNGLNRIL
jgi:hypothetical protein